ncbi:MAG: putative holliday junction resolvase [Pelagibacterales bacterium]|nr:putative holliday junction resolvase [Pelagibacterales bacterium]
MNTHNILSINDFKTNFKSKSRLIGIDPGGKNIGIAICDENRIVATPLKTLKKIKFEDLVTDIKEIINENEIKGIIIGNPINMDGSMGKSSQSASDFARNLRKNIMLPIAMWDERFSSAGAFKISNKLATNTSNKVKNLDKNSAAFILQGAIDFLTN